MRCEDCDDGVEYVASDTYCRVCGADLVLAVAARPQLAPASTQADARGRDLDEAALLERMFESEFFAEFRNQLERARQAPISQETLKTLGKLTVDERQTILYDVTLQIEDLRILAVPASFSGIMSKSSETTSETTEEVVISAPLVLADPICGENALENERLCKGALVIFRRGKVSFASKAVTAMKAGAVGIIVCQSYDVWPFMMSDSANEIPNFLKENCLDSFTMPIVMISKDNAEYLETMLEQCKPKAVSGEECKGASASAAGGLAGKIRWAPIGDKECAVCKDDLSPGTEVLKLPCRHIFHHECIFTWLEKHNNCPMCRMEV